MLVCMSVYQERLKHYARVEYKELPDVPAKGLTPEVLKEREGEVLMKQLKSDDVVLLLDENGEHFLPVVLLKCCNAE